MLKVIVVFKLRIRLVHEHNDTSSEKFCVDMPND